MLDHVLVDAIGALRTALDDALLERQVIEERFTTDTLLGDTRWETSYSLPGEGHPPDAQADLTLLWATWSQSAYRTWLLVGALQTIPELDLEVVFRVQNLAAPPDPAALLDLLPPRSPALGRNALERLGGPTIETIHDESLTSVNHAVEVSYQGALELHPEVLADGNRLDEILSVAGGWISSRLVALSEPR